MKTALIAGAMLAATFTAAPQASAANVDFALKLAGPNGVVQIASPGGHDRKRAHKRRGRKGHDFRRDWRPRHGWQGPRYRPWRPVRRCMNPGQLRWFLHRHGWYGYRVAKMTPGIAVVYAHRWDGFRRVKVDLCRHRIIRVSR